FIFTKCAGTCPTMSHEMAGLASDASLKDVRFVSISVDPDNDTPAVLRDYAKKYGADAARWTFLTGTRDAVRTLAKTGFKLPVEEQKDAAMPILHSSDFVLLDREGRIRGAFDGTTDEGRKGLRAAI